MIKTFTDEGFEADVLNADIPTLVVFIAEWAGPCRLIAPVLEEVANSLSNQVAIGTIDIDTQSIAPTTYELKAVPTLMVFSKGEPVAAKMGALTTEMIVEWLVGLGLVEA